MRKLLSRLIADTSGVAAPTIAISMFSVIGMVGVSLETGYWFKSKSDLQMTADMAAYAGVVELLLYSNDEAKISAELDAINNGFESKKGTIAVTSPASSGEYTSGDSVEVTISQKGNQYFTSLFGEDKITYNVRAVAALVSTHEACILALNKTTSGAIGMTGSVSADLTGCSLVANSSNDYAITLGGSSSLDAACLAAVGGISGASSHATLECKLEKTGAHPVKDPYANILAPDTSDYPLCQSPSKKGKWGYTMNPGRYCSNITLKGTAELSAGTYIFDSMNFKFIGGASKLIGSGVTIVLMNGAALSGLNGKAVIDLTAPTSGDYKGIAIYSDPVTQPANATIKLNGGSATSIEGLMYFPTQRVEFGGNTSLGTACSLLVADTVSMKGNADFEMTNCESLYGLEVPAIKGIYVVE